MNRPASGKVRYRIKPGLVVSDRYRVCKNIGSGSFGEIYSAYDILSGEEVAIKIEAGSPPFSQLRNEHKSYKVLGNRNGLPHVKWFGKDSDHNVMVLTLLGPSLERLWVASGCQFKLETVVGIAEQMITLLEYIHSRHLIHRDIKPDNILLGTGSTKNIIHIIDFGLAKPFRSAETYIHISCHTGQPLMGTARFASINALSGIELSRRDDLESLAYMLIYFLHGLPWQGIRGDSKKKHAEVLQMKVSTSSRVLCDGLPAEFETFLNYARALEFSQKPNYQYLRDLMHGVSQWPQKFQNTLFDNNLVTGVGVGIHGPDSSKTDETDEPAMAWKGRLRPQKCLK